MSQIIKVDGAKLFVYTHDGRNLLSAHDVIDAYELALFLGYAQQHLLRKQILTDWKNHLKAGRDYLLVKDKVVIRAYERAYASRMPGGPLRPMAPHRGRLLLLPPGTRQVLLRSTKERAGKLLRSLEKKLLVPEGLLTKKSVPAPGRKKGSRPLRRSSVSSELPDATRSPLEVRREGYAVMQKLLEQLRELEQPHLQLLAVEAAEIMLGRSLSDLRSRIMALASVAAAEGAKTRPRGALFGEEGYYSLTQIGRKAGYSSRTAGRAANIVADQRGHSPEAIRTEKLPFNLLRTWTDELGSDHELFRFDRNFSNEVLDELRSNPHFKPRKLAPVPDFAGGDAVFPETDVAKLLEEPAVTPA